MTSPTGRPFAGLAYWALLVLVFGYLLWFYLLRAYGATSASAYHFLMPPLGLMFGWLLLGERPELTDLLGTLPVGLGIYLATRRAQSSQDLTEDVSGTMASDRLLFGLHHRYPLI